MKGQTRKRLVVRNRKVSRGRFFEPLEDRNLLSASQFLSWMGGDHWHHGWEMAHGEMESLWAEHTHDHGSAFAQNALVGHDDDQHHHHDHDHDHDHDHGYCGFCGGAGCPVCSVTESMTHQHPAVYDEQGNQLFVEPPEPVLGLANEVAEAVGMAPLADTFRLHSLPGASQTIYLDFDGHVTEGTTWNSASGQASIASPAYSFEGDGESFSDNELARIQRIWQRVAEDFAPFEVNVTTEDPGAAALSKTSNADNQWGTRVVITEDWDNCGCGGFAYVGSFNDSTDEPVFVFNAGEIGVSAATTHEVGHALGLSHDGTTDGVGYYNGHGSGEIGWGPIMGSGYYSNMTTWDAGDYYRANNSQDDWQIITTQNGFGFRNDDHGDTSAAATELDNLGTNNSDPALQDVGGFGVIELDSDTDWFRFQTDSGAINLTIDSYQQETFVHDGSGFQRTVESTPFNNQGSNLDVLATLYDSNLAVVATSNPSANLNALFADLNVAAGTYYLAIDGVGVGDWTDSSPTGYDQSVSRGQYAIRGTIVGSQTGLIARNDSGETSADTPVSINVLGNDTDPQGGSFEITSLGVPQNGQVTELVGVVTYIPNAGFSGSDSFGYTITDDQGDTASATVTVVVLPTAPSILFVDDDQGEDFERFYTAALAGNNLLYDVWEVATNGLPANADLAAYETLVWNTGDDYSASDAGLSDVEQTTLMLYLNGGGNLFLVGQDVLYSGVSSTFRTDYLHVENYTNDVRGLNTFVGVAGSAIGDGMDLAFDLPSDFSTDWSDTLSPTAGAEGVFYRNAVNTDSQPFNTVSYRGNDFKVVFMAAPFEGISTSAAEPDNQTTVMGRIMEFFSGNNTPPVATNNSYSVFEDAVLNSGNVITDDEPDTDPDGDPLAVDTTAVVAPLHGALVLQPNGQFSYTPDENYHGSDSFVYRVTDAQGGADEALVEITVVSVNDAPVAKDDEVETAANTTAAGNVLANDFDVDGDPLTIVSGLTVAPSNGTLTLNANGNFTYEPNLNFSGDDSFQYTVTDGVGGEASAKVFLTVTPVNQPPVAVNDDISLDEDGTAQGNVLANDSDPEEDELTVETTPVTDVAHGSLSLNADGSFTYIPEADFYGSDSFVYQVADVEGDTDTATVVITVESVNDAPTLNAIADLRVAQDAPQQTVQLLGIGSGAENEEQSFTITAISSDPAVVDNPTVNYQSSDANGSLHFTPRPGVTGTVTITVTVFDDGGTDNGGVNQSSRTFEVDVAAPTSDQFYFSRKNSGTVTGASGTKLSFQSEDIVAFDGEEFRLLFDGTPWVSDLTISAFAIEENGAILMSFSAAGEVPDVGSIDDSDIVRYDPTSNMWELYFDGSQVGLTRGGEDIDGIAFAPDGRLLVSTVGSARVSGVRAADEDLLAFAATSLGSNTSGSWSLYLDGSDIGLSSSREDVDAVSVTSDGTIYVSTTGNLDVDAVSGKDEDVAIFDATTLGSNTTGTFRSTLYFDGSAFGFGNDIGGMQVVEMTANGLPESSAGSRLEANLIVAPEPTGLGAVILEQQMISDEQRYSGYADGNNLAAATENGGTEPLTVTGNERTAYDDLAIAVERNQLTSADTRSGLIDELLADLQREVDLLLDEVVAGLVR